MSSRTSNIIKATRVSAQSGRPVTPTGHRTAAPASCTSGTPAQIELHRNGEVIEAIEVTCSCGQTMIIECVYEDQESAS